MAFYAYTGDDIGVTINSVTYRAYRFNYTKSGNAVGARAYEDAPGDEAIVMANKFQDVEVGFRENVLDAFEIGDTCTISLTVSSASLSGSFKITNVNGANTVDGIADFSITARRLPGA